MRQPRRKPRAPNGLQPLRKLFLVAFFRSLFSRPRRPSFSKFCCEFAKSLLNCFLNRAILRTGQIAATLRRSQGAFFIFGQSSTPRQSARKLCARIVREARFPNWL